MIKIFLTSQNQKRNYQLSDEHETYFESAPEESTPFTLELPINKYRLYVCCDYPKYDTLFYLDCDSYKECKNLYLKLYSQINDCLPFEVTGWTTGYKEDGYYPEVPEDIKSIPNINLDKLQYDEMFDYFVIAIDDNGNEYFTELL